MSPYQLNREALETSSLTDRQILVQVYNIVAEMNGTLRRHETDLYGDMTHQVVGVKQVAERLDTEVECLQDVVSKIKTGLRVAYTAAGAMGAGVIAVLAVILERLP